MQKSCLEPVGLKPILPSPAAARPLLRSAILLASLAAVPLTAGVSRAQQSPAPPFSLPDASSTSPKSGINRPVDDPMTQLATEKRLKELNVLRQKEIASDAAKLLALAAELKANVDKGEAGSSSLELMHKAEQIEKLARTVRTRMTDGN